MLTKMVGYHVRFCSFNKEQFQTTIDDEALDRSYVFIHRKAPKSNTGSKRIIWMRKNSNTRSPRFTVRPTSAAARPTQGSARPKLASPRVGHRRSRLGLIRPELGIGLGQ